MQLAKFLPDKIPPFVNEWLEEWDLWADRVCLVVALGSLALFFFVQPGQFLCLSATTASLGTLAVWRIWTYLRDGMITPGRASFLFGSCVPLFIIYAALIWAQQFQGEACSDKLRQDFVTIGSWLMCCLVGAGPGGLIGACVGYFFTGTSWTLFENASGVRNSCRNLSTLQHRANHEQPFLKKKDLYFIVGLTAASTLSFLVGISIVLRMAAAGYSGLGLIPTTMEQLKVLQTQPIHAPVFPSKYRFVDPMSTE